MRTQSSYFWWRHHLAAAAGSPCVVPEAASAGPAKPSATAPAATARMIVLAMLRVFIVCPFLVPLVAGWLRKDCDVGLFVISTNSWSDLARGSCAPARNGGSRLRDPPSCGWVD